MSVPRYSTVINPVKGVSSGRKPYTRTTTIKESTRSLRITTEFDASLGIVVLEDGSGGYEGGLSYVGRFANNSGAPHDNNLIVISLPEDLKASKKWVVEGINLSLEADTGGVGEAFKVDLTYIKDEAYSNEFARKYKSHDDVYLNNDLWDELNAIVTSSRPESEKIYFLKKALGEMVQYDQAFLDFSEFKPSGTDLIGQGIEDMAQAFMTLLSVDQEATAPIMLLNYYTIPLQMKFQNWTREYLIFNLENLVPANTDTMIFRYETFTDRYFLSPELGDPSPSFLNETDYSSYKAYIKATVPKIELVGNDRIELFIQNKAYDGTLPIYGNLELMVKEYDVDYSE